MDTDLSIMSMDSSELLSETSPAVRPDLGKFRQSYNILKVFGNCLRVNLIFGKMLNLLWKFLYAIGHLFIATNGQIWKKIKPSGHTVHLHLPPRSVSHKLLEKSTKF